MSSTTQSNDVKQINSNAHTIIMQEMSQYLDNCKEATKNCQCTGVLEYNPMELNDNKKWLFLYQCNNLEKSNKIVKKL
jgi:hypothetical protein